MLDAVALVAAGVAAAPFGLPMGAPIEDLKVVRALEPHLLIIEPPVANPAFSKYMVLATPAVGVCSISATTRQLDFSEPVVRSEFERIRAQLALLYGRNFIEASAQFTAGQSTIFGRMHITVRKVTWSSELPHQLQSIVLESSGGLGSNPPFIRLEYSYLNKAECYRSLDAMESRGL